MGDGRLREVVAHKGSTVRKSMIYKILRFIKMPEMILLDLYFFFKVTQNAGLLLLNSLKQNTLLFN